MKSLFSTLRRHWVTTLIVCSTAVLMGILLAITGYVLVKCPARSVNIVIQDHVAKVDSLHLYYRTAGNDGNPPIVFLHGWGARMGKRCSTDHVIEALAEYFYVIAPEHPGLIRSEAPMEVWSWMQYTDALNKLLEPLGLQKPIIMGQSFGGGIATAFAAKYPANVGGLILVDAVITNRPSNWYLHVKHAWDALSVPLLRSRFTPSLLKKGLANLWLGAPYSSLDVETVRSRAIMGQIDKYKDIEQPLDVDYKEISQPLILVWGDQDTFITPLLRAREIHTEVDGSQLIVVPGSHTVLYQRPREIAVLIFTALSESMESH